MAAPRRRCPLCDTETDLPVCPRDRMATLLIHTGPRPALPEAGRTIAGRYELARLLGKGGFGSVFAARHLGTGQEVALKILEPPEDGDDSLAVKRFFLEARVTSGLRHPNTVRVFDFGQDDGGLVFLAMELLHGRTLRQEMKRRKGLGKAFSEGEAIGLATAVTKSLAEAHAAGLVHRDLKPDNVFLAEVEGDDPVVKVLDFGIVKLAGGHPTLSTPTSVPGTPAYMSPEHALSGEVDARSDLYSLGVILYQLVSNELPFQGSSDAQTLYKHAYEPIPDLATRALVPLSAGFLSLVERALAKAPAGRFRDALQMREALGALTAAPPSAERIRLVEAAPLAEDLLLAPPRTPAATATHQLRLERRRPVALALAAGAALILGTGLLLLWPKSEPPPVIPPLERGERSPGASEIEPPPAPGPEASGAGALSGGRASAGLGPGEGSPAQAAPERSTRPDPEAIARTATQSERIAPKAPVHPAARTRRKSRPPESILHQRLEELAP